MNPRTSHATVHSWPLWHYTAQLIRVIDGDTIRASISVGLRTYRTTNLRIAGINAPEVFRGDDDERERGAAAKAALEAILGDSPLYIETERDTTSFDRYIGHVWVPGNDGTLFNVAEAMIDSGHAASAA